jgi:hypothetical protein
MRSDRHNFLHGLGVGALGALAGWKTALTATLSVAENERLIASVRDL